MNKIKYNIYIRTPLMWGFLLVCRVWVKAGNPGANFFGISKSDELSLENTFTKMAIPIIEKSIDKNIRKAIKIEVEKR
jgi:hypothetical protein